MLFGITRVIYHRLLLRWFLSAIIAGGGTPFRRKRRYIMATVVYLVVAAVGVVFLAISLVAFQSSDRENNKK